MCDKLLLHVLNFFCILEILRKVKPFSEMVLNIVIQKLFITWTKKIPILKTDKNSFAVIPTC